MNENTFKERLKLFFIKNQRSSKYRELLFSSLPMAPMVSAVPDMLSGKLTNESIMSEIAVIDDSYPISLSVGAFHHYTSCLIVKSCVFAAYAVAQQGQNTRVHLWGDKAEQECFSH